MITEFSVACYVHGDMKRRENLCWWDCVGFDGEECRSLLTDEALDDILHNGPIRDDRCLPLCWYYNQWTGILEIVVGATSNNECPQKKPLGAKDAQRSAS